MSWSQNWDRWDLGKEKANKSVLDVLVILLRKAYKGLKTIVLRLLRAKAMLVFSVIYAIVALIITICCSVASSTSNASDPVACLVIREVITSFGVIGLGVGLYKDVQAQRVDGILLGSVIKYYNPFGVGYLLLDLYYILLGIIASYTKNFVAPAICFLGIAAYLLFNAIIFVEFMTPYGDVLDKTLKYAENKLNTEGGETLEKTELRRSIAASIADKYNEHALRLNSPIPSVIEEKIDLNYIVIILNNIRFEENPASVEETIRIYIRIWEALLSPRPNIHSIHGLSTWIMYGVGIESTSPVDEHARLKEARMFIAAWVYNIYVAHLANLIHWSDDETAINNWGYDLDNRLVDAKKEFRNKLDKRLMFITTYMLSMFEYASLYHNTKQRIDNSGEVTGQKPEELRDILINLWIFIIVICVYVSLKKYQWIPALLAGEFKESTDNFIQANKRILEIYKRQDNKESLIDWALYVSIILEDIAGIIPYGKRPIQRDQDYKTCINEVLKLLE